MTEKAVRDDAGGEGAVPEEIDVTSLVQTHLDAILCVEGEAQITWND